MREGYQEASRLSTRFHSTSRWVLKVLGEFGWSGGGGGGGVSGLEIHLPLDGSEVDVDVDVDTDGSEEVDGVERLKGGKVIQRRRCKVLEVGAINTELVDTASRTRRVRADRYHKSKSSSTSLNEATTADANEIIEYIDVPTSNLTVRAIDLHSSHPSIEQCDFFTILNNTTPTPTPLYYDAIVCSMVLNCVPTPAQRGTMLTNIHTLLHPNGLLFLVLPRLCLIQSKYLDTGRFEKLLVQGIGYEVERRRTSPKLAFWVLRKKAACAAGAAGGEVGIKRVWKDEWGKVTVRNKGKKYRNEFCVVLNREELDGIDGVVT